MDVVTHGMLPFLVATALRRPRHERHAVGIAGVAPDTDTLWSWASSFHDAAYPFMHRGLSHTFWGAPLLAILWYAALRAVARRRGWSWPAQGSWASVLPLLVVGSWSHLLLDSITTTGIPLWWPLAVERTQLQLFFYSVLALAATSVGIAVWTRWRKPAERHLVRALAVCVAILVVAGTVRLATRPDAELSTPAPLEWRWYAADIEDDTITVWEDGWGAADRKATFLMQNATSPQAAEARAACEDTKAWLRWHWNVWLHPVASARRVDGGWRVDYDDAARLYDEAVGGFGPDGGDDGLTCIVHDDGTVTTRRDGGFWG